MFAPTTSLPKAGVASARRRRTGLATCGALILAALLIALLIGWSGISAATLGERLQQAPLWLILALAVAAVAQSSVSALKWRLVLKAYDSTGEHVPGFRFCLFYSCLSALVSQFVPVFAASVLVRSIGARRLGTITLARGAVSSAFEQAFDLLILFVLGSATVLTWLIAGGIGIWIGLIVSGLILSYVSLLILGRLRRLRLDISRMPVLVRKCLAPLDDHFAVALFDARLSAQLLTLSLLRYLAIMVRVPLLVLGMSFLLPVIEVTQGFTLVQATQLAAITPGNLGLQEWGWTATLALRGAPVALATEFALSLRVLTLIGTNIGLGLLTGWLLLRREPKI